MPPPNAALGPLALIQWNSIRDPKLSQRLTDRSCLQVQVSVHPAWEGR